MLGMHGTVAANYAVDKADLLLAIGVRFDDRVTGKLESFASRARIVHIDIDPAEINKNKASHITVCADAKPSLQVWQHSHVCLYVLCTQNTCDLLFVHSPEPRQCSLKAHIDAKLSFHRS